MTDRATLRAPLYRLGSATGIMVPIVLGGLFAGIYAAGTLFNYTDRSAPVVALVAVGVAPFALAVALGWMVRARLRRPLAILHASGSGLWLTDRAGHTLASCPLAQARVRETWHFRGSRMSGSGGGHPAYTLVVELGGCWAISAGSQVVMERGFAVGEETAPNVQVAELDYLRLRRLLLPHRAAILAEHMRRQEAYWQQTGLGERPPV